MQRQDDNTGQAALEQRIREHAYKLWLAAGQPHGQEDTFPASDPPANSGITGA